MLNFDFDHVRTVEFGVGRDDGDGRTFCLIAVDGDVQDALQEMAVATWEAMQGLTKNRPNMSRRRNMLVLSIYICR